MKFLKKHSYRRVVNIVETVETQKITDDKNKVTYLSSVRKNRIETTEYSQSSEYYFFSVLSIVFVIFKLFSFFI